MSIIKRTDIDRNSYFAETGTLILHANLNPDPRVRELAVQTLIRAEAEIEAEAEAVKE